MWRAGATVRNSGELTDVAAAVAAHEPLAWGPVNGPPARVAGVRLEFHSRRRNRKRKSSSEGTAGQAAEGGSEEPAAPRGLSHLAAMRSRKPTLDARQGDQSAQDSQHWG